MIQQQVQLIKVQPAIVARAEALARKTYKIGNWLKLISMHLQNNNEKEIDNIIRNQIHQNFVMEQSFWTVQLTRRLSKPILSRDDIEVLLLCFEDGPYFLVSTPFVFRIFEQFKAGRLSLNYSISVMQRVAYRFSHNKAYGHLFYKSIRNIYQKVGNIDKIRECYQRELKGNFDTMDITFEQYKMWQTDPSKIQKMRAVYYESKRQWEQQRIDFDQNKLSKLNVRHSLYIQQTKPYLDQDTYIKWIDLLPNQTQKLEFLRRAALWHKKMIDLYLAKCQQFYQADEDRIITKYKVGIRISQNSQKIQEKYIGFLVRRINKHLICHQKQLQKEYYDQWGNKVAFFRQEINQLISKQRNLTNEAEQKRLFHRYYKIWIQVEQNIVKDKEMVCRLHENLLKDSKDLQELEGYQAYAKSMIQMSAFKDAKNILRRCMLHCKNSQQSQNTYRLFINYYGTIQDQMDLLNEEENQRRKSATAKGIQTAVLQENKGQVQNEVNPTNGEQNQQSNSLKRERNKDLDEVQQKIENSLRKKVHVDGQNTVFMKGIPSNWTETDVLKVLKNQMRVLSVRLVVKNSIQKDYCYIEFDSKQSAQQQVQTNQSGYKLNISRPPADYDQSKTLFLCALPLSTTADKISNIFNNHFHNIIDIRLKLQKDKNYAYVDFNSKQNKDLAFNELHNENLLIDGKKILMQHCDSNRQKNKKFAQVVFLKGLAFKTQNKQIEQFFKDRKIVNISIPRTNQGKGRGFAYVEFEKFKDYQEALDLRKGNILGREFQILKSDRQITQSNPQKSEQRQKSNEPRPKHHNKKDRSPKQSESKGEVVKDNNYFSSLFK